MTLEHVLFSKELLDSFYRLLRPGGAMVFVTHDYRSTVDRILGKRSPIIDIEHMQIFSSTTMEYLLENRGLTDIVVKPFRNSYRISYWTRLLPLPIILKDSLILVVSAIGLKNIRISIGVGNIMSSGFKS